ncbi:MAG: tripartite tricarboxylate transporter permease [Angelakisella sp.]|nr:tripartite tricarboxylate transporter permease [Angelakisella sp.]
MLTDLLMGFQQVLQPATLLALLAGTVSGYFIGAMPGLTPTIGIALLIPFTYGMEPVPSIVMLVSLYMAAEYGGGITAILVNTPGTPAAAATALDGYPLAKQGKATKALGMSIIASGIGALISTILMVLFAIPLASVALKFGAPEYFALAIFGLSVVAGLSSDNIIKGLLVVAFGLLLTTIGIDPIAGTFRYTFTYNLMEGIPFTQAMIGLFAISEVFNMIANKDSTYNEIERLEGKLPTFTEIKGCLFTIVRGSLIGFAIGMLPAAGANVACWVSYNAAKQSSKNGANFGKGELEGIAAPESANNAAVCGAMVPLLTLGIPGSSSTAVLIGALTLHGMQPGPLLFDKNPEIPFSIFAALLIAVPIMMAIGLCGTRIFAMVTLIPNNVLAAMILGTCILGAYALSNSMFGIWVALIFGVIGFFLRLFKFPIAPMVLALVLGNMAETNYRVAMLMGGGNATIFFTRPFSVAILILTLILFCAPILQKKKRSKVAST